MLDCLYTTTDLAGRVILYVADNSSTVTVDKDGTSSILVWGVQAEAGAFPSSYIATAAAAVTRNSDLLTAPAAGNADTFPMTINLNITPSALLNNASAISVDDGSSDRAIIYQNGVDWGGYVAAGGVLQAQVVNGAITPLGVPALLTLAAALNDTNFYFNGSPGTVDTACTMPATPTTIRIGARYDNAMQPYASIRNVKIFDERLTDAEGSRPMIWYISICEDLNALIATGLVDEDSPLRGMIDGRSGNFVCTNDTARLVSGDGTKSMVIITSLEGLEEIIELPLHHHHGLPRSCLVMLSRRLMKTVICSGGRGIEVQPPDYTVTTDHWVDTGRVDENGFPIYENEPTTETITPPPYETRDPITQDVPPDPVMRALYDSIYDQSPVPNPEDPSAPPTIPSQFFALPGGYDPSHLL